MKKFLRSFTSIFSGSKKNSIESELRAQDYNKYPNDIEAQNYIYSEMLSAYNYMGKVTDPQIKSFVSKHYPSNYTMQKYIYDKQLTAKNYMNAAK
ncbi:MAG: hypothetical protein WBN17_08770 [Aureibaculum sp.]